MIRSFLQRSLFPLCLLMACVTLNAQAIREGVENFDNLGKHVNTIELSGGDLDFFMRSLPADFGEPEDPDDEYRLHWPNLLRKDWSDKKIDLRVLNAVRQGADDSEMRILLISCHDESGADLLTPGTPSHDRIVKYVEEKAFRSFAFVSSGGLKVRAAPSMTAPVLMSLPYGEKVSVMERTKLVNAIKTGKTTTQIRWVKIFLHPRLHDGAPDSIRAGYVPDIYLAAWNEIQPGTLYRHWRIYSHNLATQQGYDNARSTLPIPADGSDPYLDSLKTKLQLEIGDGAALLKKKIKNLYALDTTHVERNVAADSSFWLRTKGGTDSLHIRSEKGEVTYRNTFAGQIAYLNQYVVRTMHEEPIHVFYDKQTGQGRTFTAGLPYVSPDGQYALDFFVSSNYAPDYCTSLTLSKLDKDHHVVKKWSAEFNAWLPDQKVSGFWVSNRELVIRVIARHAYAAGSRSYQYIKVRILD